VTIGAQWVMEVHIAAAVFPWMLLIFGKRVPYDVRYGSIVFLYLFVELSGFWKFGMIVGASPILLSSPVMATALFGTGLGGSFSVSMVLMMIVTAYSFNSGVRVFATGYNVSGTFLPAWINYTLTVTLTASTSISAILMSNRHLMGALLT
jgi:hypothetical protein